MADTTKPKQKLHGRAFYESIGSPRYVLAPMVDQSEFAWRLLTRSFLPPDLRNSILAYTPMFHAKLFADSVKYRGQHFEPLKEDDTTAKLDGNPAFDRPLFVQFCANDPDALLAAASKVQDHCDAVDLNLGCPQGIAKRGHYGAFLQEDWDTIHSMIRRLHEGLDVPVTAKMRVLETKERSLEYAKMILDAGASIITVHGRQREQKGHNTGLADWSILRYLRENLPKETVMFANGNILQYGDIERCLEATGVDGVMSAEGNLYDPSIFAAAPEVGEEGSEYWRGRDGKGGYRADAVLRRYMDIIHRHVMGREPPMRAPLFLPSDGSDAPPTAPTKAAEANGTAGKVNGHTVGDDDQPPAKRQRVTEEEPGPPTSTSTQHTPDVIGPRLSKKQFKKQQKAQAKQNGVKQKPFENEHNPNLVAMQAHCFHILRPLVSQRHNVRDALARCKAGDVEAYENVLSLTEAAVKQGLLEYEANPAAFEDEAVPEQKGKAGEGEESKEAELSSDEAVQRCKRPYWVCQPYVRPLPKEALEKGSMQLSKKEKRRLEVEAEEARKAGLAGGGKVEDVDEGVEQEVTDVEKDKMRSGVIEGEVEKEGMMKIPAEGMVCG